MTACEHCGVQLLSIAERDGGLCVACQRRRARSQLTDPKIGGGDATGPMGQGVSVVQSTAAATATSGSNPSPAESLSAPPPLYMGGPRMGGPRTEAIRCARCGRPLLGHWSDPDAIERYQLGSLAGGVVCHECAA